VKVSNINAYFINPDDYSNRMEAMIEMLNKCGFNSVNRIVYNEKFNDKKNTITKAHLHLINTAINDKAFPFIIFEDDATQMRELPEEFNIPVEAELIYLGGSTYAPSNMYIKEYNNDFYRVYNMLTAHAIIVPDMRGASTIIRAYNKAFDESKYSDELLAKESHSHVFLVPKEGNYFYQNDYTKDVTKFEWKNIKVR